MCLSSNSHSLAGAHSMSVSYHSHCTAFVQPVFENKRAVLVSQVEKKASFITGSDMDRSTMEVHPLADLWSSVQIEAAGLYPGAAYGSKRSEHDHALQNARG